MKGIMFNLLEGVVARDHGEDAWDEVIRRAGVAGVYTSLGSYPDGELLKLITATAHLRPTSEAGLRWFGRNAMAQLAERYAVFFVPHASTSAFLLTLNDIIHPEVRKIYPDADAPDFDFELVTPERLILGYHSARKLCELAEGLIAGAAHYYQERVSIEQPQCMLRGDDKCVLHCEFAGAA